MTRRVLVILSALALLAVGCGATGVSSPAIPAAVTVPPVLPNGARAVSDTPDASAANRSCNGGDPQASLAPRGPLPGPGHMPVGSTMAAILQRGHLNAGVDQNTLLWGYRNPEGQLAGFDIDMVDQVARALFGPSWPSRIRYVIVPNADRIPAVASGRVDVLAETMTITCSRQQAPANSKVDPSACCVDFSSEYYAAAQRILVPVGSPIHSVAELAGKRVCAAQGSTSLVNLSKWVPAARQIAVANQTDCLVMLQQGQADAISTDDTILQGLAAQDPNLELLKTAPLSDEPYGMAISKAHPDLTRFVNGVLAQERSDGEWAAIWTSILGPVLHTSAPRPPAAAYRD
jgi:polar amino acid transport system substrate-binding protein